MPKVSIDLDQHAPVATHLDSLGLEWRLYHRVETSRGAWQSLILLAPEGERKRRYFLGWNGKRLNGGNEPKMLRKRHPKVWKWLLTTLVNVPAINVPHARLVVNNGQETA